MILGPGPSRHPGTTGAMALVLAGLLGCAGPAEEGVTLRFWAFGREGEVVAGLVPAFERLFERQGGDFARFYAEVARLASLPQAQRHATLRAI